MPLKAFVLRQPANHRQYRWHIDGSRRRDAEILHASARSSLGLLQGAMALA